MGVSLRVPWAEALLPRLIVGSPQLRGDRERFEDARRGGLGGDLAGQPAGVSRGVEGDGHALVDPHEV